MTEFVTGRRSAFLAAALCLLAAGPGRAGVSTDGTVGPLRDLNGAMTIGEGLGRRVGDNLFHSFRLFNIATGESATFTGSADIANVISRVTGGSSSTVNGLLRSQVGQANFFLINPAGVVFGPNAQIDVPGAFHVSTADRLNFPDGYYSATDTAGSTLSMATPESFGFLAHQPPADIIVRGSNLALSPHKTVSLVGGNVTATKADIDPSTIRMARISSEGGDVRVVAVGALGEENRIAIADGSSTFAPKGRLEISGQTSIDVGGAAGPESVLLRGGTVDISASSALYAQHSGPNDSAGVIRVDADDITITDSAIDATSLGEGRGALIDLAAKRSFEANAAQLYTGTFTDGASGDIRIRADDVRLSGGSEVNATTFGPGRAGSIEFRSGGSVELSDESILVAGSYLQSDDIRLGDAGRIKIEAQSLRMLDSALSVSSGNRANAGTIDVAVAKNIEVSATPAMNMPTKTGFFAMNMRSNGAPPLDATHVADQGRSGTIRLKADKVQMDGEAHIDIETNRGDGGGVTVDATSLVLLNGALIWATTMGSGKGGDVSVSLTDVLAIAGKGMQDKQSFSGIATVRGAPPELSGPLGAAGSIDIEAGKAIIGFGGIVRSDTSAAATGGDINVRVGSLEVRDGGIVSSQTYGPGTAGNIYIDARERVAVRGVDMQGTAPAQSVISTASIGTRPDTMAGLGEGGNIRIASPEILVEQAGWITSSTLSDGSAGSLSLTADRLTIRAGGQVQATTSSAGDGGDIDIQAPFVSIDGRGADESSAGLWTGVFSTSSEVAMGNAGSIRIRATDALELVGGAQVSASTMAGGDGGSITVTAGHLSIDQAVVSSLAENGAAGFAGNVNVTADQIDLSNQGRISIAAHQTVAAERLGSVPDSRIQIAAGDLRMNTGATITAESTGNVRAGTIEIIGHSLSASSGAGVQSDATGSGDAGRVALYMDAISLDNAQVGAATRGSGAGGALQVSGQTLSAVNRAQVRTDTSASGAAGRIDVSLAGLLTLDNADISATTNGSGAGGGIRIASGALNAANSARIGSSTAGSGNAGTLDLDISGRLALASGAELSTSTKGAGDAGRIGVTAGTLAIDNASLASRADASATGFAGDIDVTASVVEMRNQGQISIAARQRVPPERLSDRGVSQIAVTAGKLNLDSSASITAESSGNVAAGGIQIDAVDVNLANLSRITTESANADGGPIGITAATLWLTDSQITTSVLGPAGDGGDIRIRTGLLGMDGGLIQANTAAPGAAGGDIYLVADHMSLSHGFVWVGGNERLTFRPGTGLNVIQAAAPHGVQGSIQTTVPQLDVTKGMMVLATSVGDPAALVRDRCRVGTSRAGSSLVEQSVAGIPAGPAAPAAVSFAGERLDLLLARGP